MEILEGESTNIANLTQVSQREPSESHLDVRIPGSPMLPPHSQSDSVPVQAQDYSSSNSFDNLTGLLNTDVNTASNTYEANSSSRQRVVGVSQSEQEQHIRLWATARHHATAEQQRRGQISPQQGPAPSVPVQALPLPPPVQLGSSSNGGQGDQNAFEVDADGRPHGLMYDGFVATNLKITGDVVHPNIKGGAGSKLWTKLEKDMVRGMTPVRALRILVPVSLFARDAKYCKDWALPSKNGAARAYATSSLVGLLFAGTAMGMPSGNHAEQQRSNNARRQGGDDDNGSGNGRKTKSPPLAEVDRYVYIPASDQRDELPMFRIMYEELKNTKGEVTFIGIWLLIFDPTHSTSALVDQVMRINASLVNSQSAASQDPNIRNKACASESERRRKSGYSFDDLNDNFDSTVGMQYGRIYNMETYYQMLQKHSGRGTMFVQDLETHVDNPNGRHRLEGDRANGHGGLHPAAPEFAFCAKRNESLAYGSTNLDGTPGDIDPAYLDAQTYWNGDVFNLPDGFDIWMCTSVERRTPMDLPLPRPLQNQVVPGEHLMRLFIERTSIKINDNTQNSTDDAEENTDGIDEEDEEKQQQEGDQEDDIVNVEEDSDLDHEDGDVSENPDFDSDSMNIDEETNTEDELPPITPEHYAQMRSFATGKDQEQAIDQEEIRKQLRKYDHMDIGSNLMSASDTQFFKGDEEGCYRIKTEKMTDRIARESTHIYSALIVPWMVETKRDIENERSKLEEQDVPLRDGRWDDLRKKEIDMQTRYYNVKSDLAKYHLRSLFQCFHSTQDRTTLPNGYKSMVSELERLVAENKGSANMAFPPGRKGKQIIGSDRQVWQELQEWLGVIFSKDALIAGRDRFLMISDKRRIKYFKHDELYLQYFDVYSINRFVLIICSDRGKGKSIRSQRLSKLMPRGFMANQAASSNRAGMNGNMSPNNGCYIIFDEMTRDLTPAEVDERLEFWKQTLSNGEYTIERTCRAQKSDGSDSFITCEIVTDHSVSYAIMTNHGPCFTPGREEPSSGKLAMVNRTICLPARTETTKASPESAFEKNMQSPQIMERVNNFRLFTCLVAFCKLALRKCSWLHPDMGLANKMWEESDRILTEEYNMPTPEPRRTQRRSDICQTMTLMEAVARVLLYKQTAVAFEAGRPIEGTCDGKKFDIGDLWDVIRIASVPSRAVIRDAWVKSLSYSIATSPLGINMMTSVCHLANMRLTDLFRKMPSSKLKDILSENNDVEVQVLEKYLSGEGAKTKDLIELNKVMEKNRRLRCKFMRVASVSDVTDLSPLEAVKQVLHGMTKSEIVDYTNALFPTLIEASMHYEVNHVLRWAGGLAVDAVEVSLPGRLKYRKLQSTGGAQLYDHAWVVAKEMDGDIIKFGPLVADLRSGASGKTPVNLFDIHDAGAVDTLMLLETNESARLCAEMPINPKSMSAHCAFQDENKGYVSKDSKEISLREFVVGGQKIKPSHGDKLDIRKDNSGFSYDEVPALQFLDLITSRGRLPALQTYTTTRFSVVPPIRRVRDHGVLVNVGVGHQHVKMVVELSLRCTQVDGLKGHQETFSNNNDSGLDGLSSCNLNGAPIKKHDDSITTVLPYSNDIVQIGWAIDISERQYIDTFDMELKYFNEAIEESEDLGDKINEEDMPQQHLACMGYPVALNKHAVNSKTGNSHKLLQLLSLKVNKQPKVDVIEVGDSIGGEDIQIEVLKNEVGISLGRKPTNGDIEAYKMDRIGENYMWGVKGDLHAYSTWCDHAAASMIGKGNAYPSEDEDDITKTDPAILNKYDTELMLQCRMLERKSQIKGSFEHKYNIKCAWPQTYSALLKKAAQNTECSIQKQPTLKRPLPPTMTQSRGRKNPYSTNKKPDPVEPVSPGGPGCSYLTETDVRDL